MHWLHKLSRNARSILHLNRPREVAVLTKMLGLDSGHRLLDVGCGDGYLTTKFARHVRQVVGIDPDATMLAKARLLHSRPNIEYEIGLAEKLPYADAAFDRVVAVSVVEHFNSPGGGLKEMARVLKPGGVLAISVDSLLPENSPDNFRRWHAARYHVTTYFRRDQILALLRDCGLIPDEAGMDKIHTSQLAGALRRFYMRHKAWCFPFFPFFLVGCRFADATGLGGRMPPQILIVRAEKPR